MTFIHAVIFWFTFSSWNYLHPSHGYECLEDEFSCDNGCIDKKFVCDYIHHCLDGKDERDCFNHCYSGFVPCDDGMCISGEKLCNGISDCALNEDEERCAEYSFCGKDFFCLENLTCIKRAFVCDGLFDCPDGADEMNCKFKVYCTEDEFKCNNGECIYWDKHCDNTTDCFDGSDEINCTSVNKANINKCFTNNVCSQLCVNELGNVTCQCLGGYIPDPQNLHSCISLLGHGSLLFTQKEVISKFNLDKNEIISLCSSKSALALDYDYLENLIFWNDNREKKIYKSVIDDHNICRKEVVLSDNLTSIDGIAVDWIYKHIYWTDNEKNTIELANYDGSNRKTIIKDDLDEPRALAVHPIEGWLFWTDWGKHSCIERSWLDGSQRHRIIKYGLEWPNGLTLDFVSMKLYWADAKLNSISSSNYDGSEQMTIISTHEILKHPFSITVFEDFLYWTDLMSNTTFKADKFSGKNITPISMNMSQAARVVQIWHPSRQQVGENYCKSSDKKCSHLCFPAYPMINKSSFICACPDGLVLSDDNLNCFRNESKKEVTTTTHEISNNNAQIIIISVSIGLLVIVSLLVGFVIRNYYRKKNENGTNYNNPVYRQTTQNVKPLEVAQSAYSPASEEVALNFVRQN